MATFSSAVREMFDERTPANSRSKHNHNVTTICAIYLMHMDIAFKI